MNLGYKPRRLLSKTDLKKKEEPKRLSKDEKSKLCTLGYKPKRLALKKEVLKAQRAVLSSVYEEDILENINVKLLK